MNKDNAVHEYIERVIKRSWTWERLTDAEKLQFFNCRFSVIKGTANQRIEWLCSMYTAFLMALGYQPIGWREDEKNISVYGGKENEKNKKAKNL